MLSLRSHLRRELVIVDIDLTGSQFAGLLDDPLELLNLFRYLAGRCLIRGHGGEHHGSCGLLAIARGKRLQGVHEDDAFIGLGRHLLGDTKLLEGCLVLIRLLMSGFGDYLGLDCGRGFIAELSGRSSARKRLMPFGYSPDIFGLDLYLYLGLGLGLGHGLGFNDDFGFFHDLDRLRLDLEGLGLLLGLDLQDRVHLLIKGRGLCHGLYRLDGLARLFLDLRRRRRLDLLRIGRVSGLTAHLGE